MNAQQERDIATAAVRYRIAEKALYSTIFEDHEIERRAMLEARRVLYTALDAVLRDSTDTEEATNA